MQIIELEVVARDGIEPSTRGFSVRRRPGFRASKPKTGDEFSRGRPNRPARPSPCRTGTPKFRPNSRGPDPVQRLAGIATELFPNRAPNWAAPGSGSLALTALRPAVRFTTLQSGTVNNDPERTLEHNCASRSLRLLEGIGEERTPAIENVLCTAYTFSHGMGSSVRRACPTPCIDCTRCTCGMTAPGHRRESSPGRTRAEYVPPVALATTGHVGQPW